MNPMLKKSLLVLIFLALAGSGYYVYCHRVAPSPEQRYRIQTVEKGDLE